MNNDVDVRQLPEGFDAYCICTGAPTARDLPVPGRELKGIHPALDMLAQQNRILAGMTFPKEQLVTAKGKKVLVIGGGDTGSDCIGTSNRQGALSVTQIEIMPQPPVGQNPATPWPVFVAGDAASGASLVVRAIASGRKAATDIDSYLNK